VLTKLIRFLSSEYDRDACRSRLATVNLILPVHCAHHRIFPKKFRGLYEIHIFRFGGTGFRDCSFRSDGSVCGVRRQCNEHWTRPGGVGNTPGDESRRSRTDVSCWYDSCRIDVKSSYHLHGAGERLTCATASPDAKNSTSPPSTTHSPPASWKKRIRLTNCGYKFIREMMWPTPIWAVTT
jgi:hypothetical protein